MISPRISTCLVPLAALFALGCVATEATQAVPGPESLGPEPSARFAFPAPPPPTIEMWDLPEWAATAPAFPYLPGEDRDVSRSIGNTSHGWLHNAVRIPQPHPYVGVLAVQHGRDLDYTTREMWKLIESAAQYVNEAQPDSTLYVGNFSARGGGDIPYSVSHNSGRDGDVAFYLLDGDGEPAVARDLVTVDDDGTAYGRDGTEYTFDVARNWKFVEGLVENGRGTIQYVFISNGLRKMLLEHAREVEADAGVIAHAAEILQQPGGALPHNDHFHIRTYCSAVDVASGCVNEGRRVSGFDAHRAELRETVRAARGVLTDDDAEVRLAAVRRLSLLADRGSAEALSARLEDDDPRVRSAAARALARVKRGEKALGERLGVETDAAVRAELVWAIAEFGTKSSVRTLAKLLDEPQPARLSDDYELDLRVLVADALAIADDPTPVEPLIALVAKSDDATVRSRAHRALTMLTNFDPDVTEADLGASWQKWYAKHGKLSRDRWLLLGFKARGYEVERLALRHVWDLATAILDDDHLSYNAQRVLMRLSRRTPASLEWSKEDANFYWRRWFERRCKRLGCPPVPADLSTL